MWRKQLLTAALVLCGSVSLGLLIFLLKPLAIPSQGLRYQLVAGASLAQLVVDLTQQQVLHWPWLFKLVARLGINSHKLQAGVYFIKPGTNSWDLLQQFTKGRGRVYYSFTIVPGWSQEQLYQMLAKAQFLQHQLKLHQSVSQLAVALSYQLTNKQNAALAGWFAADTYYYLPNTADLALLKRAYHRMQQQLLAAWRHRDPELPWHNPAEALIAASLVEKETGLAAEQAIIAGVLINRLQHKMRLQFDSTPWYAVQQWCHSTVSSKLKMLYCDAKIPNKQHLAFFNPYNTYLYAGLPPQAIAIPSLAAIKAVLQPRRHHYLYFVATGYGGHKFSTTLAEQQLAIRSRYYRQKGFYNVTCLIAQLTKMLTVPKQVAIQVPQLRSIYGC